MTGHSVAAVVFKAGRLLLARRRPGGDIGGKWELPGGKVEPGETAAVALVREIAEELGVEAVVGPKLAEASFFHGDVPFLLEGYEVSLKSEVFVLTVHDEIGWFGDQEAFGLDLPQSDRRLLSALFTQ